MSPESSVLALVAIIAIGLCVRLRKYEKSVDELRGKLEILEEVLGNFGATVQQIKGSDDTFGADVSGILARLGETMARVNVLERNVKTFNEINQAIASEQRKQPMKARSFSQFRTAAEEN